MQDVKDKLTSKVDELTQQGKRLVEENMQPKIDETIEQFRNVDWSQKQAKASAYVSGAYKKLPSLSKTTMSVIIGVLMLIIVLLSVSKCNSITPSIIKGGTVQNSFLETLDDPSTAFVVRIDKALKGNNFGVEWVEVPEGQGSRDASYKWTLLFFPENETKKTGRAVLEAWKIDKNAWATAYTKTYRYEVREGIVELYNGYNCPSIDTGWTKVDDIRLHIEKEDDLFFLRGVFARKERLFKQSQYIAAPDKENHYVAH